MTIAEIIRLAQASLPGLPSQIIRAQVLSSHRALCSMWPWSTLEREFAFTTMSSISGTINPSTLTTEDDLSALTSLTLTESLVHIRLDNAPQFHRVTSCTENSGSPTTYTLAVTPATTLTDSSVSYEIFRSVYELDSSVRQVLSVRYEQALEERDTAWIDRADAERKYTGTPSVWANRGTTPSGTVMIEIWPRPVSPITISYRAQIHAPQLSDTDEPYIDAQLLLYQALLDLTPVFIGLVKDPALAQMVKLNSKDWREQRDALYSGLVVGDISRHSTAQRVRDVMFSGSTEPEDQVYQASDITGA